MGKASPSMCVFRRLTTHFFNGRQQPKILEMCCPSLDFLKQIPSIIHRIHVCYIWSHGSHQYIPFMLAYIPYMDPMGNILQNPSIIFCISTIKGLLPCRWNLVSLGISTVVGFHLLLGRFWPGLGRLLN